jgi:biopolymer transport protein ExbB/TolQ
MSTSETVWALAWPTDSAFSRFIVSFIFILLAWAVFSALFHLSRIGGETRALSQAIRLIREWRELALGSTGADADNADRYPRMSLDELGTKLVQVRGRVGAHRHVAKLLDAVRVARIHRMKVNLASLQQVVERDEATRSGVHAPRHVANFAVMLGILGTFYGLGHMVSTIGSALPGTNELSSAASWARSVEQIRGVLSGMKTAFATSLVGMFAAIVAGLVGVYLSSRQQRLLQTLEAFAVNELLPATAPSLEDESVLEQVSAQLESAFSHIDEIAQQNRKALEEMSAAQGVFRSLVEDVRAITHGEAGRDLTGVLDAVVTSNAAVQNLVAELPRITQELQNSHKTMLASLAGARARTPEAPIHSPPRSVARPAATPGAASAGGVAVASLPDLGVSTHVAGPSRLGLWLVAASVLAAVAALLSKLL